MTSAVHILVPATIQGEDFECVVLSQTCGIKSVPKFVCLAD